MISEFNGDNRWLSNFHPSPVTFEGFTYPSSEHAYVAAKTLDLDLRREIAHIPTCGKVKRAGRKLVLRSDWEQVKFNIMHEIVKDKFMFLPTLKAQLISTGSQILEEGNRWGDRIWGVSPARSGNGQNKLGKILMLVREEISIIRITLMDTSIAVWISIETDIEHERILRCRFRSTGCANYTHSLHITRSNLLANDPSPVDYVTGMLKSNVPTNMGIIDAIFDLVKIKVKSTLDLERSFME